MVIDESRCTWKAVDSQEIWVIFFRKDASLFDDESDG